MRHLSAERLASLPGDTPTADEAVHLATCAACRAERDAHCALVTLAADERERTAPPLADWGALSARLAAEGLLRTREVEPVDADVAADGARVLPLRGTSTPARPVHAGWRAPAWASRAAAAALLTLGGVVAGRVSAGGPALPAVASSSTTAPSMSDVGRAASGGAALVANTVVDTLVNFASAQEAIAALQGAQRTYQSAIAFLAAQDTSVRPGVDASRGYRTRLAALDDVMSTTREALSQAPYDPVINQYYLATVSAREQTLRQIDDALPVNSNLTRF